MASVSITVTVRKSRREIVRILRRLPGLAAGRGGGLGSLRQVLMVRMGLALLKRIKDAFIIKAAGGTDDAGERWKPLSPMTIAYRRRHPKLNRQGGATKSWVPKSANRAADAPSYMLTPRQRERWWALYRHFLHLYHGDKSHAAATAWTISKAEGARTLMSVYGQMPVLILRDTGLLLNSLSPGCTPEDAGPTPPKVKHQIFRGSRGEVVIGSNRQWVLTHHDGVPGRIPQRRLWPKPEQWPPSWWSDVLDQGQQGLLDIAVFLLSR